MALSKMLRVHKAAFTNGLYVCQKGLKIEPDGLIFETISIRIIVLASISPGLVLQTL